MHVTDLAIELFQCPGQPDTKLPITNYMMVVGPHTISNGREATKDHRDHRRPGQHDHVGRSGRFRHVCWAEPEDLHFDKLNFTINGSKRQEISSYHRHGANAAFCDGSVRLLKNSTNPQLVKAMLTIDGGEPIPPSD